MPSHLPSPRGERRGLHPRNRYRERYDFEQLVALLPALAPHVRRNRFGNPAIDFADPLAVKTLNQALLRQSYGLECWDLPPGALCPPIPGRVDYLHHLADRLAADNGGVIPRGKAVRGLDIGTGASCIYPLLGCCEYGWRFVGSDIEPASLEAARLIVAANPSLRGRVECRLQRVSEDVFRGLIKPLDRFDFSLCNPPFHASAEAAAAGSRRKVRNLGQRRAPAGSPPVLNFGGQAHELWCEGGELGFVRRMITQSAEFGRQCLWFSTLVSKQDNLAPIDRALQGIGAAETHTLTMAQGQKVTRLVCWSLQDARERAEWRRRYGCPAGAAGSEP